MAQSRGSDGRRKLFVVQKTVRLVVEGEDEEAWVGWVKKLYISRGCGLSVSTKNAHGKGAAHVITAAIREKRNTSRQYDIVAALFDTDTDWSIGEENRGKRAGIVLLPSTPCFEATLLAILGKSFAGSDSNDLKRRLAECLGGHPPRAADLSVFTRELLESHKAVDILSELLALLHP